MEFDIKEKDVSVQDMTGVDFCVVTGNGFEVVGLHNNIRHIFVYGEESFDYPTFSQYLLGPNVNRSQSIKDLKQHFIDGVGVFLPEGEVEKLKDLEEEDV